MHAAFIVLLLLLSEVLQINDDGDQNGQEIITINVAFWMKLKSKTETGKGKESNVYAFMETKQ